MKRKAMANASVILQFTLESLPHFCIGTTANRDALVLHSNGAPSINAAVMRRFSAIIKISILRFFKVSGSDHAAAFAFYAFFSLFPIILLLVSFASIFVEREVASKEILTALQDYLPLDAAHQETLEEQINAVVDSRLNAVDSSRLAARLVGFLALVWAGLRFFKSLVHVHNLIWQCREIPWWHTPAKSATLLLALGSALVLGMGAPTMFDAIESLPFTQVSWLHDLFSFSRSLIPPVVLFYGLFLFYKLSPQTSVSAKDVWIPAIVAALLLTLSRKALISLAHHSIAQFNVGVLDIVGVFIAMLWSVYLAGQIIIWCGCLGAAIHETRPEHSHGIV